MGDVSPPVVALPLPTLDVRARRPDTLEYVVDDRVDAIPTAAVNGLALVARAPARSALFAPDSLEIVRDDFKVIFRQISLKLSLCKLTKGQEKLRELLYEDIGAVRDLIMTVLRAHRQVASTVRQVTHDPSRHGRYSDMNTLLKPARISIGEASSQLSNVVQRLQTRSKALKESVGGPESPFRAVCELLVNWHVPKAGWGIGISLGIAAPTWASTHADPEALQMTSTKVVQLLLSIGVVALGPTVGAVVGYLGRDAPNHKAEVVAATKNALVSTHALLTTLGESIGDLELYWKHKHQQNLASASRAVTANGLLQVARTLDKHVDDCLVMVSAIHSNIALPGRIPTRGELHAERVQGTHGVPSMIPYPRRHITYGGFPPG